MSRADTSGAFTFFSTHHLHEPDERCFIRLMGHRRRSGKNRDSNKVQKKRRRSSRVWSVSFYYDAVQLKFGEEVLDIPANSFIVIPGHQSLEFLKGRRDFLHSWMRVSGRGVDRILKKVNPGVISSGRPDVFERCWKNIHMELIAHRQPSALILLRYIEILVLEMQRVGSEASPSVLPRNLAMALQAIDREGLHLKPQDLATAGGCSVRHLSRTFQQHLGVSPTQYLHDQRMQRAVQLLGDSHGNLKGIADQLGYGDAFAFSKAFRRTYNMSPSAFREMGGDVEG